MVKENLLENGKWLMGLDAPSAAVRRKTIPAAFDIPADLPDDVVHRLDDVGAGRGPPQVVRQTEPDQGRKFIATLENGSGHIRRVLFEAPCKIGDQAFAALSASSSSRACFGARRMVT